MTNNGEYLCRLDDIADGGSRGFYHLNIPLFAVRQGQQLFLYRNQCPHLGLPLEWQQNQFLNIDQSMIQCATHGALFIIESGQCIHGPCEGNRLQSVDVSIIDGAVYCKL